MKTEIALHEIVRIDEYAEAEAETISADSPTPADAMKQGESPTGASTFGRSTICEKMESSEKK